MGFTDRKKLERDRARREAKKENDRTDATSTMPKRLPQGELPSPAVTADNINDLPAMSSTPKNIRGRPTKKVTPFNSSLSGPLSSIDLNSSAGMKRAAVPPQGPPSKFGRSGGQLSIAALSGDEMEVDTDSSTTSTTSKRSRQLKKNRLTGETLRRENKLKYQAKKAAAAAASNETLNVSRSSSIASVSSTDSNITTESASSQRGTTMTQDERAAAIIAEQERQEREAEKVAQRLNNKQFKVPAIPTRQSVRSTRGQAPNRFADEQADNQQKSSINEVTANCRHQQHKGYGCGAVIAKHLPDYFDSLENYMICPDCKGMNFAHDSDCVKCCLKGRVDLARFPHVIANYVN